MLLSLPSLSPSSVRLITCVWVSLTLGEGFGVRCAVSVPCVFDVIVLGVLVSSIYTCECEV